MNKFGLKEKVKRSIFLGSYDFFLIEKKINQKKILDKNSVSRKIQGFS